ncbi:MAG: hypothetical protein ACKOZX_01960 [Gammaproteobacteria bacterium]
MSESSPDEPDPRTDWLTRAVTAHAAPSQDDLPEDLPEGLPDGFPEDGFAAAVLARLPPPARQHADRWVWAAAATGLGVALVTVPAGSLLVSLMQVLSNPLVAVATLAGMGCACGGMIWLQARG